MDPIMMFGTLALDALHLVFLVLALGLGFAWWQLRQTAATAAVTSADKLEGALAAVAQRELRIATVEAAAASIRTELGETKTALAVALSRSEEDKAHFAEVAQKAVREAHGQFLERADERFGKLVEPIGKSFEKFEAKVEELGKDRSVLQQQLKTTETWLKDNREATSKLVTALSAPKGGGQWGEESLKRCLDYAGLREGVDYEVQVTMEGDRPDALIYLPSGRTIVIDAKVSAAEFLLASHEPDESLRSQHLKSHAGHVRQNMKRLADKAYQKRIRETADFVVMYIPGENMFSSALANDPSLFEDAFRSGVVISSPSSLVALAKTIALGWQQEAIARNAQEVADLGKELYNALTVFGQKVQALGTNLEKSVKSYNDFVGSLEGNVMPKGRKFKELGAIKDSTDIKGLVEIETSARMLRVGRDIRLDVLDAEEISE
jgi:DNA recombination protein RmuC